MDNALEILDTRHIGTNPHNWTVIGTLFEDDADMVGTDVTEGFSDIGDALSFIKHSMEE